MVRRMSGLRLYGWSAITRVGVGGACLGRLVVVELLELLLQSDVRGGELACGACSQVHVLHILLHVEVLGLVGARRADADGEDGQVVELHGGAVHHQLLDARHGIGQDALDGARRIGRVVACHVLGEVGHSEGAVHDGAAIPLAERFGALGCVLIEFVISVY
jgi:hypothetical protein